MEFHMPRQRWIIVGILVCGLSLFAQAETPVAPPIAKRVEHRETWHGDTVVDEYHWLREKSNPAVIEYLEAENAYAEAMTHRLKPFQETLYKEMLGRIKQS